MADDKKYSFITVSADDDDDVVIQAGIPAAATVVEPELEPEPVPEPEPAEDFAPEPEPAPAAEPLVESAPAPAPAVAAAPSAGAKQKSGYRETTLEDLDSAPMGTTQKVIIVAAVLGVLAFVAYYLFFM